MTTGTKKTKIAGIDTITSHACDMPLFAGRWRHKVYICDCDNAWTVKSYVVATESPAPVTVHRWVRIKIEMFE